jgi:hypothetical protein
VVAATGYDPGGAVAKSDALLEEAEDANLRSIRAQALQIEKSIGGRPGCAPQLFAGHRGLSHGDLLAGAFVESVDR